MESVSLVLFLVSFTAALLLFGLTLAGYLSSALEFWPPPRSPSWQSRLFKALFRIFIVGLVSLSLVDLNPGLWRTVIGMLLAIAGFGFAIDLTSILGWRSAFGEAGELRTDGAFRWSRNPIYIASIVGMIGWGLAVGSSLVATLLFFWGAMYCFAPIVEEPWLTKRYGKDYLSYMKRTPRYFGRRPNEKYQQTRDS